MTCISSLNEHSGDYLELSDAYKPFQNPNIWFNEVQSVGTSVIEQMAWEDRAYTNSADQYSATEKRSSLPSFARTCLICDIRSDLFYIYENDETYESQEESAVHMLDRIEAKASATCSLLSSRWSRGDKADTTPRHYLQYPAAPRQHIIAHIRVSMVYLQAKHQEVDPFEVVVGTDIYP